MAISKYQDNLYLGTSGWSYQWQSFYPKSLSERKKLTYLAKNFNSAEINNSFYRLPSSKTYNNWLSLTKANQDFKFSLKLSRYISHVKRLKQTKTALRKFLKPIQNFEDKILSILVQLPENYKADTDTLNSFLSDYQDLKQELKINKLPLAFEFRHKSWLENDASYQIIKKYHANIVLSHSNKFVNPQQDLSSAKFSYIRLHGPYEIYASDYSNYRLNKWADLIVKKLKENKKVFVYFNNDKKGFAPKNALSLKKIISNKLK
ncbi:MAG: DUF72 domain-containing protein [Parcubacteria group bacterium]